MEPEESEVEPSDTALELDKQRLEMGKEALELDNSKSGPHSKEQELRVPTWYGKDPTNRRGK